MKPTVVIGAAVISLLARYAEAFFMPAGAIAGGAFSTSLSSSTSRSTIGRQRVGTASHGAGCSCSSCSPRGSHGKSCTCPSCFSSAAVSGLSHGSGCRCGACSVRMQAHPDGCRCGGCSTAVGAFHVASCMCPTCVGSAHRVSCTCGACMASGRGKRAASSLTVMGMGAGQQTSELGAAATAFRQRLVDEPQSVVFEDTMAAVTEGFDYSPKR